MHIKQTGGDGIIKMEHEDFVTCNAVTIFCGLTWTCAYFCPRERLGRIRIIGWIDSHGQIHPVFTEPPDMMGPVMGPVMGPARRIAWIDSVQVHPVYTESPVG